MRDKPTTSSFSFDKIVKITFQTISYWLSLCFILFSVIAVFFWDPFIRYIDANLTEAEITNIYSSLYALKHEIEELLGFRIGTMKRASYIGRMWLIGGYLGGSIWFWITSVGVCLGLAVFGTHDSDSENQENSK